MGGYGQADVDAWLAHVLAAHRGHHHDPATRAADAILLTTPGQRTPTCSANSSAWFAGFLARACLEGFCPSCLCQGTWSA